MKKIMIVTCIILLAIGFNAVPALAYTNLGGAVTITATGTLAGDTKTFDAKVVNQGTDGTPGSSISFTSPNGITDSGKALRITGGTNEVDARIIIYTDNNSQFNVTTPEINPATGADGGGLVGQSNKGYAVAMFWGMKSAADLDPNTNSDYVFGNPAVPVDGGPGNCNYIVDKRHTATYCTKSAVVTSLDSMPMYPASGPDAGTNLNTANDGLYPQLWNIDMRTAASGGGTLIPEAQALYKNIATVAFNVGTGGTDDPYNYICTAPKLTTTASTDSVKARLLKLTGAPSGSDAYMYLPIGADFRGVPAQVYSTTALIVEMVQG